MLTFLSSIIHKPRFKSGGFTLIEVMVAVGIFAVIASIVGPAMVQFLNIRERVNDKQDQLDGLQKTFLFLANDFRYASNRLGKDEYGELGDATLSVGDDSLVDLTTSYPDLNLDGLNVPRRVRWVLEDKVLQRIQSPVMDPGGDTRVLRQNLLKGVDDVEIELSIVADGRDDTSKRWDEQNRLPDKISVMIEMESGVKYQRVFTMLGADNIEALAASLNQNGGNNSGSRPPITPNRDDDK
jgi:general secretion pathway protein J